MIEKQPYSAPLAETFVVQTESQLCVVSPNTVFFTEFLTDDGYEAL